MKNQKLVQKSVLCLVALFAVSALSACNSDDSPKAVVQSAGKAVQKGNLKEFQKALQGQAAREWGNPSGLSKLQSVAANSKRFTYPKAPLLSTEVLGQNRWNESYRQQVLGDGSLIATAAVSCLNEKITSFEQSCHQDCHFGPEPGCEQVCTPHTVTRTHTACRITDIDLK